MRLVIIDAANCFYRAFFAIPLLRNRDGFPTNALLGFTNMLRKVIREEQPEGIVIALDPPGGSFRKSIYPQYKANRDAQPEDLSLQFQVLRELIDALRISKLEVPGFEADDIVATLVKKAPQNSHVVIVSTDRDLMQLVSSEVNLLDTIKNKRWGPAEVEERFGVTPEELLDFRALVGDASDNIPGVKGIGEKGAAKLIEEWGNLESVLSNSHLIKGKRTREALTENADEARLSKTLSTLRTDIPLEWDEKSFFLKDPDSEKLSSLLDRLELTRLKAELLPEEQAVSEVSGVNCEITCVSDGLSLSSCLNSIKTADVLSLALASPFPQSGFPEKAYGLAIGCDRKAAFYLDFSSLSISPTLKSFVSLFESESAPSWMSFDTKILRSFFLIHGFNLPDPYFDINLAAFLVNSSQKLTVESVALRAVDLHLESWEDLTGKGAKARKFSELSIDELSRVSCKQSVALFALEKNLSSQLKSTGVESLFKEIEIPLTRVLSNMECCGVRIDKDVLALLDAEFSKKLVGLERSIHKLAGEPFSIGSPKQLQRILFEKLSLPVIKKTKTGYSTDEGVLVQLAQHHDLPSQVLDFRRLSKLRSTYVKALPPLQKNQTGRVHPIFHQNGAATGRLSCSNPNVQNIPIRTEDGVRIREAFVPKDGHILISADYSQVELRVLAHYSEDLSLIDAFSKNEDIHTRTASEVSRVSIDKVSTEMRAKAKAVNFGIVYGLSAFGLSQQLGIATSEAEETIKAYFSRYEGIERFLVSTREEAKRQGYVQTLLGRRRYLPDLGSKNKMMRSAAERMAVNTVIQGTAADLIKKAMITIDRVVSSEGLQASMILQVHDELVFEVSMEQRDVLIEIVREHMENVYQLRVPLTVEVNTGTNWRGAH